MRTSIFTRGIAVIGAAYAAMFAFPVHASEGGNDNIGKGSEGFFAGALPERPGFYGIVYINDYEADRFNDGSGRSSVPNFDLSAKVAVGRLYYQSPATVAGGRLGFFVIGSFASLRLRNGREQYRYDGIGDVTVGPVLGWKIGDLHPAMATDFVIPVGSFTATRTLNTGANYYAVRPITASATCR